jgi:hypothetical protein
LENTLNDWTEIISASTELAPAAGILLLTALAAWLLWRMVRRVARAFGSRSDDPRDLVQRGPPFERREPILEPAGARNPPPAQVSEIHALRASIDALTRQVADLSGKLAGTDATRIHVASRPSPVATNHEDRAVSIERRAALAPPRSVSLSR